MYVLSRGQISNLQRLSKRDTKEMKKPLLAKLRRFILRVSVALCSTNTKWLLLDKPTLFSKWKTFSAGQVDVSWSRKAMIWPAKLSSLLVTHINFCSLFMMLSRVLNNTPAGLLKNIRKLNEMHAQVTGTYCGSIV